MDVERAAGERVAQLADHLVRALPEWSLAPVVDSRIALRGVDKLAAIVLRAELGDISPFDSPKELLTGQDISARLCPSPQPGLPRQSRSAGLDGPSVASPASPRQ